MSIDPLDSLRKEAEDFYRDRTERLYEFQSGRTSLLDLPSLYRDRSALGDAGAYRDVRSALSIETEGLRRDRLALLGDALAETFLESKTAALDREIAEAQRGERVIDPVGGREITLPMLDISIARTPGREQRAARSSLQTERLRSYGDRYAKRWRETQEAAVALGAAHEAALFR
ncbi:MAG: hypothetical protein ACRD1Z_08090, partial [Vicinamibacteria bacterium]